MKIVILDAATVSMGDISFSKIERLGEVKIYQLTSPEEMISHIGNADIAICNKTVFTAEIMEKCPDLKYIGLFATGYNNIDTAAASRLGITVCNVPAYSDAAVAEQVFAFMLHFAKRTAEYNALVRDGGWIRSKTFSAFGYPTSELCGKTLGIIGYGRIGRAVADIALAFKMNVIVNTRTIKDDKRVNFVLPDELAATSDYISLHCPLTDETRGLINIDLLKLCKNTAVLINTSRGDVVVEKDLAYALENDIIAGAAVDVISSEPMKGDCPLYHAKNCVITPHVAWAPLETRVRLITAVAENIAAFINGSPINKVN